MNESINIIFPVSMNSVKIADDIFKVLANNATDDERICYNIRIVLSEAFSNAYLYGDKSNHGAVIEVRTCFTEKGFIATIINDGRGFADNEIKWNQFPSAERESGRGLKLIKELCDNVEFRLIGDNKFEVRVEFNTKKINEKIK